MKDSPRGPSARSVSAEVLVRIERDGAFAAAALDAELSRARQLDPRDRGLATELAYGSLRVLPFLTARLDAHAKRGIAGLDPRTRANLLLSAYQLLFLEKVPAFAAVSEAVDAVRRINGPKVAAFANAVLRKIAREAEEMRAAGKKPEPRAILASAPRWLEDALARSLGKDEAMRYPENALEVPPTCLRVEHAEQRDVWLERIAREASDGASVVSGGASPHAILVRGAGRIEALAGFAEGAWSIQEEGSQLVALSLGAKPGDVVLDACAGRGNKSAILARAVLPNGAVDAADLHPAKLDRLRTELARIGLGPRNTFAVDWSLGSGDVAGSYDRVLVDAPCSGTGTLRRRPELGARRSPENLADLSALQLAIALRASEHVKPGGSFVYAVCSVLREEGEDVAERLVRANPRLLPAPFEGEAVRALAKNEPILRLLPGLHGTDGYFLASFRRAT